MDKYARLMQKLKIINVEFFKVISYLKKVFMVYTYLVIQCLLIGYKSFSIFSKFFPDLVSCCRGYASCSSYFFHFVFETFGQQNNNSGRKSSVDFISFFCHFLDKHNAACLSVQYGYIQFDASHTERSFLVLSRSTKDVIIYNNTGL